MRLLVELLDRETGTIPVARRSRREGTGDHFSLLNRQIFVNGPKRGITGCLETIAEERSGPRVSCAGVCRRILGACGRMPAAGRKGK